MFIKRGRCVVCNIFGRTSAMSLLSVSGYCRPSRGTQSEHFKELLPDSRSTHGNVDTALLKEATSKPMAGLIANKEMSSEVARWTQQSLRFQAISRYISLSGDFRVASSVAHSRLIRLYNDRSDSSSLPVSLSLSPNLDLGQDVCDPVVAHAVCSARSDREVNTLAHLPTPSCWPARGCMRRKGIAEDRGHK